jgi:hypothetical protein
VARAAARLGSSRPRPSPGQRARARHLQGGVLGLEHFLFQQHPPSRAFGRSLPSTSPLIGLRARHLRRHRHLSCTTSATGFLSPENCEAGCERRRRWSGSRYGCVVVRDQDRSWWSARRCGLRVLGSRLKGSAGACAPVFN